MVRFSCFNPYSQWQRPKKIMEQPSFEAMIKSLHDSSPSDASKSSPKPPSLNSSLQQAETDAIIKDNAKDVSGTSSQEPGWKLEKFQGKIECNGNVEDPRTGYIRKCQSLGDGLCNHGLDVCDNCSEDEADQGFSNGSVGHNGSVDQDPCKMNGESPNSQHSGAPESEYTVVRSDLNRSIFSVGDRSLEREVGEDFDALVIHDGAGESLGCTPHVHEQTIKKSCSLLDMASSLSPSSQPSDKYSAPHHRSHEDLRALEMTWRDVSGNGVEVQVAHGRDGDDDLCEVVKTNDECPLDDDYDSFNYFTLAKDWIMPETDEDNLVKFKGKSTVQQFDEVKSGDFKVRCIEAWVNDLPHCDPLVEEEHAVDDGSNDDPLKRDSTLSNGLIKGKMDKKLTPGIEIAKKYISSLNTSATSAQLSNHGLVAIPFLSAFVSLRVLNLSGNAIERITAGTLPRGLHALNLSKNKITSIEGLRDLTRLRVLDLSYNRIVRIGHGLASCSSLKELYLVGNKISEVDGLHRLLKLTVLDLRFNKISSAKSLGQLAANYSSLQALSLEGNPAQKNVGDEQLKKHVLGLLPHLIYYNRQPTKSRTLKDAADRSVRLGISSHQFDRGHRLDSRTARKGSHGVSGLKPSLSSHARKSQVRGRHGNRPPSGTSKATHQFDWGSKLREFRSELSIRRSLSEGNLGTA